VVGWLYLIIPYISAKSRLNFNKKQKITTRCDW